MGSRLGRWSKVVLGGGGCTCAKRTQMSKISESAHMQPFCRHFEFPQGGPQDGRGCAAMLIPPTSRTLRQETGGSCRHSDSLQGLVKWITVEIFSSVVCA